MLQFEPLVCDTRSVAVRSRATLSCGVDMLIVYQSLESTGTKSDEPSTFITGNSFKRRVQNSLETESSFIKSRIWDEKKKEISFETTTLPNKFATETESKRLSNSIKEMDDDERNQTALKMLAKIIERIVDNSSACTRPKGLVRPFVRHPDVIVLGEIYASSLANQVLGNYVVIGGIDPTGDARHRFTVLVRTGLDGKNPASNIMENIEPLFDVGDSDKNNKDEDSKCMLIRVRGWLIAFVHTPNNICNDAERAAAYLDNNAQRFGKGSKLDLVMGDTNQGTSDTVERYMNGAYNRKIRKIITKKKDEETTSKTKDESSKMEIENTWHHSVMSTGKQVVRGYTNYEVSGTNSQYDKHFDIACTPQAHVCLSGLTVHKTLDDELTYKMPKDDGLPMFFFHGVTDKFVEWDDLYYAYTDHNGVIVEILRDKPEYQFEVENKKRELLRNDYFEGKRKKVKVE